MPLVNKWIVFVSSALIQAAGSPYYTFGVYAPVLKSVLSLNQVQVELVGAAIHVGCCIAQVAGLCYQQLSMFPSSGPRIINAIGVILHVVGYTGLWLIASQRIVSSFPLAVAFAFLAGNAASWFDTSTIVTCVRNFPYARGRVVGLLKSFVGIGGSAYACYYVAVLTPDATNYILHTAVIGGTIVAVMAALVNHVPYMEESEVAPGCSGSGAQGRFMLLYVLVALLSVLQSVAAALQAFTEVTPMINLVLISSTVAMMLLLFAAVADAGPLFSTEMDKVTDLEEPLLKGTQDLQEQLGEEDMVTDSAGMVSLGAVLRAASGSTSVSGGFGSFRTPSRLISSTQSNPQIAKHVHPPTLADLDGAKDMDTEHAGSAMDLTALLTEPQQDPVAEAVPAVPEPTVPSKPSLPSFALFEAVKLLSFWMLFIEFTSATGTAVTFQNNMAQIFAARGGDINETAVLVALYSVSNSCARLIMGYFPEQLMQRYGTPRTLFLALSSVLMTTMAGFSCVAGDMGLHLSAVLAGSALGAHWSLVPAILSDLFGVEHFAAIYTFCQLAPAIGGLSFGTFLAGWVYDSASAAQGSSGVCIGSSCFQPTFIILTATCTLGSICSLYLWRTSVGLYKQMMTD